MIVDVSQCYAINEILKTIKLNINKFGPKTRAQIKNLIEQWEIKNSQNIAFVLHPKQYEWLADLAIRILNGEDFTWMP